MELEDFSEVEVNLESYLPISFFDVAWKNDDFKNHIIDTYRKNKLLWSYQFSYIAYYMLFLSYLYNVTWKLKTIWDSSIISNIEAFIGEDINYIFDLSGIWEDSFCRKINNFIRCLHKNEIDEIANFVQKRNHCAHPSWIIQYNQSEIENLIFKIDEYTEKIQSKINNLLLNYVKNNLDKIIFDSNLILSENEVLFLLLNKDKILNFDSSNEENIRKKVNFLKLIYNTYTENINFEDWEIFNLFLELFKWYNKEESLYYILEEMHFFIKSFRSEDNDLIKVIKSIWLDKNDEEDCIWFIENI